MTRITVITGILLLLLSSSCSGGSIKIDGKITGLGTHNIHVLYLGDYGVVDDVLESHESEFEWRCVSSELTVITITDSRGSVLARFAARNGDKISIRGDLGRLDDVRITGNEATEQWQKFRREHARMYRSAPSPALDRAIDNWVKEHPKEACSTLLLLFDRSALQNDKNGVWLLKDLAAEARPERLIASASWIEEYYSRQGSKTIHTLNLCGTDGDFHPLELRHRRSMLYFWTKNHEDRSDIILAIHNMLNQSSDDDALVADILVDADSTHWSATCRADGATWKHYWVPGGVTDVALRELRIPTVPYFIVSDSLGRITYRGTSVSSAIGALR